MLIGHLLAARKVQTHQGTETEKEGEVQHEQDVLHGWDAAAGPTSLCVSGEPRATSLTLMSRPLSSPRRKYQLFPKALFSSATVSEAYLQTCLLQSPGNRGAQEMHLYARGCEL